VFGAVGAPEPGGLTLERLVAAVRALATRFTIAGVCVTEYEPDDPRDRELLARLADALVSIVDSGRPS